MLDFFIEIPDKCLFVELIGVNAHIVLAFEAIQQLLFILFHHSITEIPHEEKAFHLFTGMALRLLCMTLLITPLQAVTTWRGMASYQQLFGPSTFFYTGLHVFGSLSIDHALIWSTIARDILVTP